ADLVGDYLFTDKDFVRRLFNEHRNIFEKIFDEIKYLLRIVTAGSKEARQIEKVKRAFEDVYRESGEVQKNTADEGVVSYSIGFSEENNTSETQQILSLINNSMEKISDKQVFNVAYDNGIENFSKKTDYVMKVFNEQENIAHNSVIGDVELSKSGAKSTIMHGFGREKLAAIKAIKPVIENGEVISKVTNYNNTDVDRYIVAAKGVINGEKAIVGVVVKSYPSKIGNSKFYLHEAEIIKTGSPVMTAPQLSVDTVSKSAFDSTVPQKAQSVNTSISENFENDTKNILPVKNSISNKKAIESGISNNTISASDTDIRYSDRDSFTYKEYNRLIYKKPIKVSKQDWVKVNSRRTQKYAHISDENVPVLDLIKLAEYNRINEACGYVIRNIDKYSFNIVSKRKIKSEFNGIYKEESKSNEKTYPQNDRNGNREGFDRRSSESPRYGGTIRENASEIRQSSESEYDNHFGYGASDSGRGIGLSTQGHLQAVDNDNETQQNNTDVNKRFSVSADENRSDITPETSSAYSDSFINREAYYDKLRSRQAFDVDLSQIEERYLDTYKKAAESGVLNDTKRTHELVDMIAKISADKGVRFDFVNNEKISKSGFAADDKIVNGYLDEKGNIVINIDSSKALESTVGHEITHILEGTELYAKLETAITEYAIQKGEYDNRLAALTELYKNVECADVSKELVADLVGDYLFDDSEFIRRLSTEHRNIFEKIFDEIKYMLRIVTAGSKEARQLEKVKKAFENAYRESGKVQKNTAADGGVKYSFAGYAEDGKGMYKSNFPKGTPKIAKAQRILSYIQDVWSKKPIKLNITDNEGNIIKTIDAQFDPTYENDTKIVTDASKLMGGNRHGSASEQRVTLDLADDYYQIASESKYNYSKSETGKNKPTHDGVREWHYFVNDIYFAEYDSNVYKPYTVSINVKEKPDGNFVYSF
ncbi:MAG: hypothetical protein PUB42_05975, partial [Firmicutes bacterium]|nr:hypothetical protein [Bacillota bacterium]